MKYKALYEHLLSLNVSEWRASFRDIEHILGFSLPKSARTYPAWWANEENIRHSQCRSWREAGWKTQDLDLGSERVAFYRT